MKSLFKKSPLMVMICVLTFMGATAIAGLRDRSSSIELFGSRISPGNYLFVPEIASAPATPATGWGAISVRGNDIYFLDDLGVETSMIGAASGGVSNLDQAYDGGGSGAGRIVAVDQGAIRFTGTNASNNTLEVYGSGSGNLIDLTNSGTGLDIEGTGGNWSFTTAGLLTLDNGLTIDNAANNVLEINENSEELKITFGTNLLDLSSTSGIVQVDVFDGAATAITKAADGAADDLTLSVTGAQNSSLHLASAGTGADALTVTTSAGGIDITVAGGAAGEDIDISTDTSINLAATEDAASAITAVTNGGTSETIVVTNTQGTNDAAIDINATAGGIDIDAGKSIAITSAENTADSVVISSSVGGIDILAAGAAATEDIDITATGSSVHISSTEAAADAVTLVASTAAGGIDITSQADIDITTTGTATEDITISNTGGSVVIAASEAIADAVTVNASAGGVDISAAATFDIDITATGGKILGVASEAAADQFKIDAQGIVVGDAINLETTDGGIMLNADGASNGDIEVNAADDLALTAAGTVAIDSADWDINATGVATGIASVGFDSATVIHHATVELSNANIKALRATPFELVAATGANTFIELVSVVFILDYGSDVLTESADNLVVEYGTSNADCTAAIEMTGFIDQAVDQLAIIPAAAIATDAASDMVNNNLELFNTGDGEFGGNATADTTMTVKVAYRVHADGL